MLTNYGKDRMLASHGITHIMALFQGEELTGEAYSRVPVTFSEPFEGTLTQNGTVILTVPAGKTVDELAYVDAFYDGNMISRVTIVPQVYLTEGIIEVQSGVIDLNLECNNVTILPYPNPQ